MTEEQALESADGTTETLESRTPNHAPRLTGLALLLCYAVLPVAGVFAWAVAALSTGVPAGENAMTGYSSFVDELGAPVNWLAWR